MVKALAVVRTIFLIFIIGYTVRAMPLWTNVARTFDEQYARCSDALGLVIRAAWIAIAWIALETVIGWIAATRRKQTLHDEIPRGGEPPFAPPPAR
jgi:hypothetical protein